MWKKNRAQPGKAEIFPEQAEEGGWGGEQPVLAGFGMTMFLKTPQEKGQRAQYAGRRQRNTPTRLF